ncbi:DUF3667 domain-containing protein [Arcicella sp. LKC2W]|uniref:DUF3667 domain-containing protein n=1 Tax=Arcicella sp. LKC2W TaxID=2984198 RepID=UPI002B21C099|nr:DUF3667 domain-containing protein [Arcicella sp. LKC2W]MEA5460521.1 DUF3667 domain-containing protein [Arcicella sp. LKC2W]
MRKRKIRRKTHLCPNCETVLERDENYCHVCGQENHNLNVPMKDLIMEFIGSITFFETKFIDTASIIFTHPGKLTLDFNSGKRVKYMHPVRMYFWVSAIFFFVLGFDFSKKENFSPNNISKSDSLNRQKQIDNGNNITKTIAKSFKKNVFEAIENDSNKVHQNTLKEDKKGSYQDYLSQKNNKDYYYLGIFEHLKVAKDSIPFYFQLNDDQLDSVLITKNISTFISNKLTIKNSIDKEYHFYIQEKYGVPFVVDRKGILFGSVLPTIMFILLPFAAFILWFFERHSKWRFYFQHLVFTLNTHSAIFLLWAIVNFLTKIYDEIFSKNTIENTNVYLLVTSLLVTFIYFLISIKKVYQQSWGKTIFKCFLLVFTYGFSFMLIVIMGITSGLIKV